jgi:hypothetical protein
MTQDEYDAKLKIVEDACAALCLTEESIDAYPKLSDTEKLQLKEQV